MHHPFLDRNRLLSGGARRLAEHRTRPSGPVHACLAFSRSRKLVAAGLLAALPVSTLGAPSIAPLWELGAGVTGLQLPHYRGSEQSNTWLLPVPYFVYRGEFLRADRDGARAVLVEQGAFEVDLSAAGSAPARSKDNRAREGMPDLKPTFELGPNVNFTLARGPDWKVELRAPLRAAFTVERTPRHVGWTATPNVAADWEYAGWDLGLRVGALWADRRFHGLTYDVAAPFATAQRPAFSAKGGSSGWQATVGASRRLGNFWVAGFVRADSVRGAAFEGSPLVTRPNTVWAGVVVSWIFARSSVTVKVPD